MLNILFKINKNDNNFIFINYMIKLTPQLYLLFIKKYNNSN